MGGTTQTVLAGLSYALLAGVFIPGPWNKFRYHQIRPMYGRGSRPLPSR